MVLWVKVGDKMSGSTAVWGSSGFGMIFFHSRRDTYQRRPLLTPGPFLAGNVIVPSTWNLWAFHKTTPHFSTWSTTNERMTLHRKPQPREIINARNWTTPPTARRYLWFPIMLANISIHRSSNSYRKNMKISSLCERLKQRGYIRSTRVEWKKKSKVRQDLPQ